MSISQPTDQSEVEASQIAERIFRTPELPRGSEAPALQRPGSISEGVAGDWVAGSSSRPLAPAERRFFEPRFGSSFRGVRLHADEPAARAAAAVQARAFTLGSHIYFGRGEYQEGSSAGKQLLAHELAHVVQQGGSAVLQRAPVPKPPTHAGHVKKTPPAPHLVCGPNVTAEVGKAVADTRSMFRGWSNAKQAKACNTLVEPPEAAFAWDIEDLHKNRWILRYRCAPPSASCPEKPAHPVCATQGADCGSTVQVGKDCYYAGSANYVIFGTMCKLCHDKFIGKRTFFGGMEFTETEMLALVYLYKLGGLTGKNVDTAAAWASAGYHGWPSGGTPPVGDRNECGPHCPTKYRGSDKGFNFRIVWCPYSHPYAECTSKAAALESILQAIF